ncbi:hypothetical protein CR513_21031, partial [Mucuna pruriens]
MLAVPPVLNRPIVGTPLLLYISVSDAAVRVVLVQESDGGQQTGTKLRYQRIEKAALALVVTLRRLRPYFQNFSVVVRTDLPIRQIWPGEWWLGASGYPSLTSHLREEAMSKHRNTAVGEPDKGEWYLLVDRSSNRSGSGAEIILEGLTEIIIEQSLHFEFKASNNQAEYEALLAGMRLA